MEAAGDFSASEGGGGVTTRDVSSLVSFYNGLALDNKSEKHLMSTEKTMNKEEEADRQSYLAMNKKVTRNHAEEARCLAKKKAAYHPYHGLRMADSKCEMTDKPIATDEADDRKYEMTRKPTDGADHEPKRGVFLNRDQCWQQAAESLAERMKRKEAMRGSPQGIYCKTDRKELKKLIQWFKDAGRYRELKFVKGVTAEEMSNYKVVVGPLKCEEMLKLGTSSC